MQIFATPIDEIVLKNVSLVHLQYENVLAQTHEIIPDVEKGANATPKRPMPAKMIPTTKFPGTIGKITITVKAFTAAFLWEMALTLALAELSTLTQTTTETKKRHRVKRNYVCLSACLGILQAAKKDLDFMSNRALETDNGKRTKRKFKGRQ